ncbi:MAG TPA: HAD family phosphatase [Planctomycetaceae bacterium]|nr:HAD family phosphatase [Planctomycetaceae bacterium]
MSSQPKTNHRLIQGVVFDLDGLLVNTELVFNEAGQELARRRGKQMSRDVFQKMMGRRPAEAFTVMIQTLGLTDSIETLQRESEEIFFGLLDEHLRLMPGVTGLLSELERMRLPKAVATSSPRDYAHKILTRVGLQDRFAFTLGAEDVQQGKPHPEIYLKAAERLGITPPRMLVFEDSEAGTKAAAAARAFVVAVPHEFSAHHDFSPADYVADGLDDPEIRRILQRRA